MIPNEMDYIESKLDELYCPRIDFGDRPFQDEKERRKATLSAALAALAVRMHLDCDIETACDSVVDGERDLGIDAIGLDEKSTPAKIYLVQAKWADDGRAGFSETEAMKLFGGLEKLRNRRFNRGNAKIRAMEARLKEVMRSGLPEVHLVVALLTADKLHPNVVDYMEDSVGELNRTRTSHQWSTFTMADCLAMIETGRPKPVDVTAEFDDSLWMPGPPQGCVGTMELRQLKQWYDEHPDRLLERNIRFTLPASDVNATIQGSLEANPEWFWHLSNGVTVVCDDIEPAYNPTLPDSGPHVFHLRNASIVNGAQTLGAVRNAIASGNDEVGDARVLVKVVSLKDAPRNFGEHITVATNTQNKVEQRDFMSHDHVQILLQEAFRRADPPVRYVVKRGHEPSDDCLSNEEAALALVATHTDPRLTAYATKAPSSLWNVDNYTALFRRRDVCLENRVDAQYVIRSVHFLRAVKVTLGDYIGQLSGTRETKLARNGELLITQLVRNELGKTILKALGPDWDAALARVPGLVPTVFAHVLQAVNEGLGRASYIEPAFRNPDKVVKVARIAKETLRTGQLDLVIALDDTDRPRRVQSTRAVELLVQHGRIPDGTPLMFVPVTARDRSGMRAWLEEDGRRGRATWINDGSKPLIWSGDDNAHSPTGLTKKMRIAAYGESREVQGTRYWYVPGQGTLVQLAEQVRAEQDYADEE